MAVAAAVLALTACAGPEAPLSIGAKQLASDIKLGEPTPPPAPVRVEVGPPPLPPFDTIPGGSFALPPPPLQRFAPPPSPPPVIVEECPPFDDEPALRAGSAPAGMPVEGTYAYRVEGTVTRGGADASQGSISSEVTTQIGDITTTPTGYRWSQATDVDDTVTTVTYESVLRQGEYISLPAVPGVVNPRGVDPSGIYLAKIETRTKDKAVRSFAPPAPGLKVYEFDATRGIQFESSGTDPVSGESMSFTATIGGGEHINACGTALDSVTVELTNGVLAWNRLNPDGTTQREVATFAAKYAFALQFGGVLIASTLERATESSLDGSTESVNLSTTINEVVTGTQPLPKSITSPPAEAP